ncbi:MAG: hypothetical protein ABI670_23295 [Chloroflexota bacterium]
MGNKQTWGGEFRQNHLYKPFLRGALIIVLTVGCTLGAVNLAVMAFNADLSAVWSSLIQSHAYAQIFGWVGLFIMGMSYHMVPRFFLRPLKRPGLVLPSLLLVTSGILLRIITQPLAGHPLAALAMVVSALLGLCGVTLFVWAMGDTMLRGSDKYGPPLYVLYVGAGFVWFWLSSLATVLVTTYLAMNGLDSIPQSWDAPYLRGTLNGAIVTIVLGFTLRTVPQIMGTRPPIGWPIRAIFAAYTLAILLQVAGDSDWPAGAGTSLDLIGAMLEVTALMSFVALLKLYNLGSIFSHRHNRHRKNAWPERFVRTAYFWLIVAAALNFSYSLSAHLGQPVPHAFVASYHHALTVGFFSMMIVGMSMKLVPAFIGVMNKQPRLAGVVFILLVTGNTLRIACESMSYLYGGAFYLIMGLSGFIEVCALGLYGVLLWRAMSLPSYGQNSINGKKFKKFKKFERFIPLEPVQVAPPVQQTAVGQSVPSRSH